jgi:hypothetical protein
MVETPVVFKKPNNYNKNDLRMNAIDHSFIQQLEHDNPNEEKFLLS